MALENRPLALLGHHAVAISSKGDTVLAVLSSGAVVSYGCGVSGQLGNGREQSSCVPQEITRLSTLRGVAAFAGRNHSMVLTTRFGFEIDLALGAASERLAPVARSTTGGTDGRPEGPASSVSVGGNGPLLIGAPAGLSSGVSIQQS